MHAVWYRYFWYLGAATEALHQLTQVQRTVPDCAIAQCGCGAHGVQARELEAVAGEVVRAVPHQLQQGGHPGLERVGGQADEASRLTRLKMGQVDVGRNLGQPGLGVDGAVGRCGNQVGQHWQNVVALAIDLHAQRQVEPGGGGALTLGLQLHLQCVGMGDPAFERIFQRHHKSGSAQRCVVRVRPLQPGVLGFIGGDAKNATFGRYQTHVHQAGNGVQLGFGIALQQCPALRAIGHDRRPLTGPPATVALVVKTQLHLNQSPVAGLACGIEREVQAGGGGDSANGDQVLQHGRRRQRAQALHQVGLVFFQSERLQHRGFEQHGELGLRQARHLYDTTQALGTVQVERRGVQKQLGLRGRVVQPGA